MSRFDAVVIVLVERDGSSVDEDEKAVEIGRLAFVWTWFTQMSRGSQIG